MFRTILAPPADVSLDYVSSIEKGHLSVLLDPELVARMRSNHVQRCQIQPKLASLGELPNHSSDGQKVPSRDGDSKVGQLERHVVHPGSMESEDVSLGLIFSRRHEVIERATGVVRQLGEDCSSRGISSSSFSIRGDSAHEFAFLLPSVDAY